MNRTAHSLVASICNKRKNSDIRADDSEIEGMINGLLIEIDNANAILRRIDANWRIGGYKGPNDPRSARFTDETLEIWRDICMLIGEPTA